MAARNLPVGVQSFEKIRRKHYLYVDKTAYIWNLVQSGEVYFLSRPRRFGKSLLISTMEAYFLGKRELFDGLAIRKLEDESGENAWQAYPVIRFSLSGGDYHTEDGLSDRLNKIIENSAAQYNLKDEFAISGRTLPVRFQSLIEQLYAKTGRQVVVLVDEYDKPLIETMTVDTSQEERNRQLYKGFFSILKDEDEYLKFVFFTGVTKFSKVSIFSDLNQLEDISLTDDYSGICGITENELAENFRPEIELLSKTLRTDEEGCIQKLKKMYDGYHFSAAGVGVYNPFSLLSALKQRKMGQFWFSTATPTFLVNKLRESAFTPEQLTEGVEIEEMNLTDYQADDPDPIPLFYQSGYLTITGFDTEFQAYKLSFPNDEVKYGFLNSLAKVVLGYQDSEKRNIVEWKSVIQ